MQRNIRSHYKTVSCFIILSVMVVSLFGTTMPTAAQSKPANVPNLDVVLVIDESGSMWTVSDPPNSSNSGWRIVMAKLFADLLGVDQSGATHALSFVILGAQAETVQDLTLIQDSTSRGSLETALDVAHAATKDKLYLTNIPAAITAAYQELDVHGRPGAKKVVIVLSDGKCELAGTTLKANCNQNIRQIIKDHFVGKYPVYTIAFTSAAYSSGDSAIYENLWQEIAADTGGEYFKPNKAEGDLLNVYIQILRHLFNLSSQTIPAPVQSPSKQLFNIPAGQMQAVFTIVKYNPDITTTVIRPDGSIVKSTDPDVKISSSPSADSFSLRQPAAGPWSVQLEGSGQVTVVYIPFPTNFLQVMRESPIGLTHPMGKPMDITIQIADANGVLQSSLQGLKVDVTLPDGTTQTLPFTTMGTTTYSAQLKDTSQIGGYSLHFYGGQGDKQIDDTQTVDVIKAPWMQILEPKPEFGYPIQQPLTIKAQMMSGTEPVPVPDQSDNITVTAQILDKNNTSIDLQQLQLNGGIYNRQMNINSEGTYQLTVKLVVIKPSGEQYQDVTLTSVQAVKSVATPVPTVIPGTSVPVVTPAPPSSTPVGPVLGGVGGLIVLAGLVGLGWWWFNKPSLVGALDSSGMLPPFPLSGRKPVYIGSDVHCQFNIQGDDILPRHAELRPTGNRRNPHVEIRSLDPSKLVRVDKFETVFQTLHDGNIINIGSFEFTYNGPSGLDIADTEDFMQATPPTDPNDTDSWKF